MKVIFMGTPTFAVPCLNAIAERHNVLAVCTQPDRPGGRGHKLQPSPVKEAALEKNIPVLQPETLRLSDPNAKIARARLQEYGADIFVVAAYGLLLPKGVLAMPRHGCVNIHASLLPKYRGASPIHSAILNGDPETGITIMQMDTGLDTGDIILQKSLPISPTETLPTLHDRMSTLGAEAILEALSQIENGTATRTPQNNSLATHSPLIKKSDGEINWNEPTEKILNKIRALNPWPGCFTTLDNEIIKIWQAENFVPISGQGAMPLVGEWGQSPHGLICGTANGAIRIIELQAPGKKRMPAEDFLRGRKLPSR
jgi:methionyl-tRNA formyltransferase